MLARSSGCKARPDDCGYQCCGNRSLIAKIPKLFLRTAECVARERNRFAGIISQAAGETVNGRVVASN